MMIKPDERLHLKWGTAAAVSLLAALLIGIYVHPSISLLAGGALLAWALERYQAVRREGVASVRDMGFTFAPFAVLAAIVWVLY